MLFKMSNASSIPVVNFCWIRSICSKYKKYENLHNFKNTKWQFFKIKKIRYYFGPRATIGKLMGFKNVKINEIKKRVITFSPLWMEYRLKLNTHQNHDGQFNRQKVNLGTKLFLKKSNISKISKIQITKFNYNTKVITKIVKKA